MPALAARHGFDCVGVAPATPDPLRDARLGAALAAGEHGDMDWMAREPEKRASPSALWPEARAVIMLGVNHAGGHDPLKALEKRDRASLALYAMRRDYHDVIKSRLKAFATEFVRLGGGADAVQVKVFVDTAPVMEKPLAMQAGLGWQGKHTVLISRDFGNWLFLGAVFTDMPLPPDRPADESCGTCTRCLDICPTEAFPEPFRLDSRRCIAYLTIEHKGPIAREFREAIGNRVFGCDDCLAICPWNKFARDARDAKLALREDLTSLDLGMLAGLDDAGFRRLFAGTPIKRTGRARFLRNVLIAIGNSGEARFIAPAQALLGDESPVVRGMAIWALARLMPVDAFHALAAHHQAGETDPHPREEWRLALAETAAAPPDRKGGLA